MKIIVYTTLDETLELHRMLIQRFGGTQGVRDMGLIMSSLVRPQSGYYETLTEQAAALLQSFALNHCFVDGNKRISFALTAVFLHLNGYRLEVSADEGEFFLIEKIIKDKVDISMISEWISKHLKEK